MIEWTNEGKKIQSPCSCVSVDMQLVFFCFCRFARTLLDVSIICSALICVWFFYLFVCYDSILILVKEAKLSTKSTSASNHCQNDKIHLRSRPNTAKCCKKKHTERKRQQSWFVLAWNAFDHCSASSVVRYSRRLIHHHRLTVVWAFGWIRHSHKSKIYALFYNNRSTEKETKNPKKNTKNHTYNRMHPYAYTYSYFFEEDDVEQKLTQTSNSFE